MSAKPNGDRSENLAHKMPVRGSWKALETEWVQLDARGLSSLVGARGRRLGALGLSTCSARLAGAGSHKLGNPLGTSGTSNMEPSKLGTRGNLGVRWDLRLVDFHRLRQQSAVPSLQRDVPNGKGPPHPPKLAPSCDPGPPARYRGLGNKGFGAPHQPSRNLSKTPRFASRNSQAIRAGSRTVLDCQLGRFRCCYCIAGMRALLAIVAMR